MVTESIPAPRFHWVRLAVVFVVSGVLGGCGTLYVAQAAGGQWRVMHARRPIDQVVADPGTPESLRTRLQDVRAARDFAVTALHLPDNRSYRTYADIKRPFVVWNVVATPEFSVEPKQWCFPIAGCVAYRGYFKESRARAFAARLGAKGFDVIVGGVPAYSTLGKLSDPVLSSMMRYGATELAAIIFHELAHQRLYVKDDTEFNEAFATAVEDAGLARWLASRGQSDRIEEYQREQANERDFVAVFTRGRTELRRLYVSGLPPAQMRTAKAEILSRVTQSVRDLQIRTGEQQAYEAWLQEGLNNAHLASIATYYDCVPGFERLLTEQGDDLERFYAAARELARKPRAERHALLCRSAP